jgi:putative NADH-flavin reductase
MSAIPTIAVFGASGGTGRALIARAADLGWPVRTLVRATGAPIAMTGRLDLRKGDLPSLEDVSLVVMGADAVCCVFGPRPPATDIVCADATRMIVEAMKRLGVRRLICQTGAMIGAYPENRSAPLEWMAGSFERRRPAVAADRAEQERVVRESGLDWTLVKPPRLTDGPAKQHVRIGPELRVGLLSRISRSDLAAVILAEIGSPSYVRKAVFVAA